MTSIRELLAPVKTRAVGATEGPWFASRYYVGSGEDHSDPDAEIATAGSRLDAEFIAQARTDVPRLVAAIEAVEALAEKWQEDFPDKADKLRAAVVAALEVKP